ncbi:MAG: hypothetical protein ACKO0W_01985, partial [Planctomycetota bacterium]
MVASAIAGGVVRAHVTGVPGGPRALPPELAHLSEEELTRIRRMSPLPPVAPDPTNRFSGDLGAAELGHRLFFDRRISPASVSCA